ncbi:hypothetical protein EUGRSUZ_I00200 [Eucalyptus grandis]|uniref:Uncharacterized protein n=2 Tax=Eucalyptus grandis TaxID=71139 RepID=A0ACC3JE45_EUCGR|nr:hypothetical protein EUGRSUZ_I00200 [Eucalyptus grandis]
MATMNSSVLACKYAISGTGSSELSSKLGSVAIPGVPGQKLPMIRAQQVRVPESKAAEGRRAALACLAATVFATAVASTSSADAGVIEEYLEKSKVNKELNDKKRLATSGANFARAYTVEFGTCKFPENFTGCQDLAKQKCPSFLMIWRWNAKGRTSTSVAQMSSGNGENLDVFLSLVKATM